MTDQEMLKQIWEHVMTMNRELGAVQAQVDVLMKLFWIVMTASITAVVGVIINIFLHVRDNQKSNKPQ